jgi:23S rRNA (cytosine1962-C5)-methyltransferase
LSALPYKLIDSGFFQKLEQVGPYRIVRPSAQAVWAPRLDKPEWKADARFERYSGGDGKWTFFNDLPKSWNISVPSGEMVVKPTDFGHLGIFAEQESNWSQLTQLVKASGNPEMNVLNLFAYTGGSTLAAARGGAKVVHLDASKTSVSWARENAEAAGLKDHPIRWITDDVSKFVSREVRRGSRYHGIILDPPSFGRGPKGEGWKIEDDLLGLLKDLRQILAEDFSFVLLSAHSQGYTPLALENLLRDWRLTDVRFESKEMVVEDESGRPLPAGAGCLMVRS